MWLTAAGLALILFGGVVTGAACAIDIDRDVRVVVWASLLMLRIATLTAASTLLILAGTT